MTEFKVGQKVKVIKDYCTAGKLGEVLTIKAVSGGSDGRIDFEESVYRHCSTDSNDLQILEGANMYEKGQIFTCDDGDFAILEVVGDMVATSAFEELDDFDTWFSAKQLDKKCKRYGWKLKEEPEVTEISIDEIAKKFKLKPEQVRIKKQD